MGTKSNDIQDLPDLDQGVSKNIKYCVKIDIDEVNPKGLGRSIQTDIPGGLDQDTGARYTTKLDMNFSNVALADGEQIQVEIHISDSNAYFLGEVLKDGVPIKMPISGGSKDTKNIIRAVEWDRTEAEPKTVKFLCIRTKDFKKAVPFNVGLAIKDGIYTMPVIYDPDVKNDG